MNFKYFDLEKTENSEKKEFILQPKLNVERKDTKILNRTTIKFSKDSIEETHKNDEDEEEEEQNQPKKEEIMKIPIQKSYMKRKVMPHQKR